MSYLRQLILLLAFMLAAIPGRGLAGVVDSKATVKQLNSDERVMMTAQLQLARQLMSARDYQAAADILEVLYESDPANTIISNSLKSCYEHLKQYPKGELLMRRLIEQFPDNISYKINLAENLIYQGKLDEGKNLYNSLINGFAPDNAVMFTNVVRSMINCKLDAEAMSIIDKLRIQSGNTTLMSVERAGILTQKRKYAEAAMEYFGVLRDTTHVGNAAEKGLEELLNFEESAKPSENALLDKIKVDSSGRALKVLSSHYLKSGRYDEAFHFAVRQDSATGLNGGGLIQYLRGCMERKLYLQAIRMSEYVIKHLAGKPFIGEFYYRYAESLEELGQYDRAISVYDTIFVKLAREQDKAEAVYRIGEIHLDRLNNPDRAIVYFDSVLNHYPLGFGYNGAKLSKPRAFLQLGELKKARAEYKRLAALRHNQEVAEELDYNLAMIDFYEHSYDSCSAALKRLMVNYPKGFYINDAVQISFLMDQAEEATELLDNFSSAILFEKRKMTDSTISRLMSIADAQNKALADVALFRLTDLVLKEGDSTGAVRFVERLESEFGESYYLPYGLKTKADILLTRQVTAGSAKEIYRRLLEQYPNYPFINEVREKLRKLESVPEPS